MMDDEQQNKPNESDKTSVAENNTLNLRLEEAKKSSPALVIISGKQLGKSYSLFQDTIILGRDLLCEISINESSISRKHTEFKVTPEGVYCKDLGSTNGTIINETKITDMTILQDGDMIRCGNTLFKFLKEGKIENLHYGTMYDLATKDGLTGAQNKKSITEIVQEEFDKAQKIHSPLSVIMFDIDHFKKINDTYGHLAGDFVLKEIVRLVSTKLTRQKDVVGRYGGEEFLLVLKQSPLPIAVDVAERIRTTVSKNEFIYEQQHIPVTISLGASSLDSTTKNYEDLLALADKALYDAKNQGRNRVCIR